MVGWVGPTALAAVGLLKAHGSSWKQIPFIGAIAAVAVFVSWRFSKKEDDDEIGSSEEEKNGDFVSSGHLDVYEEEDKLESAPEPRLRDHQSEQCTTPSEDEITKPGVLADSLVDSQSRNVSAREMPDMGNETAPGSQAETLLVDVKQETGNSIERVSDVMQEAGDIPTARSADLDNLEWEGSQIGTSILPAGAEDSHVSSREPSTKDSEEMVAADSQENILSTQVVTDLRDHADAQVAVGEIQVDKDVVSVIEPDENKLKAEVLSISSGVSNLILSESPSPLDWDAKIPDRTAPPGSDADNNSTEAIRSEQENYPADEDEKSEIPLSICTASGGCQTYSQPLSPHSGEKKVLADVSTVTSVPNFIPVETITESCGTSFADLSMTGPPRGSSRDSCNEQLIQSPSSLKRIIVGIEGTKDIQETEDATVKETEDDDVKKSAREEYAERLSGYDEYLNDSELSPTLRSQAQRAKATLARYLDDQHSDDD